MAQKDYYKILGVDKNATQDEIKSAYRKLAKQWHPDVYANDTEEKKKQAKEKFQEIQHAYSVLSDADKKAKYDQFGSEDGPQFDPNQDLAWIWQFCISPIFLVIFFQILVEVVMIAEQMQPEWEMTLSL